MYLIDRAAAAVSLKQPFVDWVNSIGGSKLKMETVNTENHVYLIPEHDTGNELELIIQDIYREIFEIELAGFWTDKKTWPEINYQTFLDWFDIKVNSMVFDPYDDEIEKDEF